MQLRCLSYAFGVLSMLIFTAMAAAQAPADQVPATPAPAVAPAPEASVPVVPAPAPEAPAPEAPASAPVVVPAPEAPAPVVAPAPEAPAPVVAPAPEAPAPVVAPASEALAPAAPAPAAQTASGEDLLFPNSDFEQGDLSQWRAEGEAFNQQPTLGDNVEAREAPNRAMPRGKWWVGSYEKYQGKADEKPGAHQTNLPTGELMSTGFVLTQPYVGFLVGGGATSKTGVQLIVSGEVVYSATGANNAFMRQVFWDVTKFQNQKAMLYVFDQNNGRWGCINVDDFRYYREVPDLRLFPNSDFEQGDLSHWTASGDAFAAQPTKGDNPAAREAGKNSRHAGEFWIGTYEMYQGKEGQAPGAVQRDKPQGTLKSEAFTIKNKAIAFLMGGGKTPGLEVRLVVEGKPVRSTKPVGREDMTPVLWMTEDLVGKSAEIEIVDESDGAWGHINADDFRYARQDY